MTRVHVESYDDTGARREISGKAADVIAELMSEGITTVVYLPRRMYDFHCLDPISGGKTLFVGTVEDYSADAWKVTQTDGTSEFVAKSQAVVFQCEVDEIETPQQGLGEFAGDAQ